MTRTKNLLVETQLHINITASNYKLSKRKLEGRDYLIFPVTMMVEGVHNGNQGPILHPIDELGKVPAAWNGIPIVVNHPERDGVAVSANIPEVLEESAVGKVFGTQVDGTKLKAKAWLDELKAADLCSDVLEKLKKGDPIEVSVGVFTDYEVEEGEWNGEAYSKVALNHRPDHLALLPNAVGACSIADGCGCGFSVNKEGSLNILKDQVLKVIQALNKEGYSAHKIGVNEDVESEDEVGYQAKLDLMYQAIRTLDTKDAYCYLEEMYDDSVIYRKSSPDGTKMYKQDYKFESGKIEFLGNAVEVRRKVEYVLNQLFRTKFKNKEVTMAEECTPCIKKKVDELIANSAGRWTEGDRDFLQTLKEDQLTKLAPIEKIVEKIVEKEVQVNGLSQEDKDALAAYKSEKKALRDKMILDIQANTSKEVWPDDALTVMSDENLKRILNSVKKKEEVDYSMNGAGGEIQDNKGVAPMLPGGMDEEPKK